MLNNFLEKFISNDHSLPLLAQDKYCTGSKEKQMCRATKLRYSPLFVHFLLHHVSPPGRHRRQACSFLLGLWRNTGVRGETEIGARTGQ